MYCAIEKAAAMVAAGGLLIIALYRKTPFCPFWVLEKRLYSKAPKALQRLIRFVYLVLFRLAFLLRGRNFGAYVRGYYKNFRGMSFYTDVHDWLGGYPYESVRPHEFVDFMDRLGFELERDFLHPTGIGVFGTGCDEFTFRSRNRRPETKSGGTAAEPFRPTGSQGDRTATSPGPEPDRRRFTQPQASSACRPPTLLSLAHK
jgi:2-polyprenyl-6-hydroxyphenyl methylase/3-demethylubiquinone-9 3-methyltransferase